MAKPKNKPLKRFNGQGTVYKLSGRRRRPWVAAITKGWDIIEKELNDIKVVSSFEWGIKCTADSKSLKGMGFKPKKKIRLKLAESENEILNGYIAEINRSKDGQCLFSVKIDEKDSIFNKYHPTQIDILYDHMKRITEIIDYFENKYEAEDALDRYRLKLDEPVEQKSTMTLGQVYEIHLKTKSKENLSKSTMDGIKASWKQLLKLENRPFCEIRSDEFQDIIDDWKADSASKSSLTKLKSLIYALCEYAYHNGLLKTNYSTLIKVGEVDENEREAFTDFEVELFKKYANRIDWVDTQLVLCYTGMRPVELLTLTKFSLDMEKRLITGGVKTDAGKDRIVPIHPLIYPIFQKFYDRNGETLFCDLDGKALTTRTYRENRFRPALEAINEAEAKEALKISTGSEEVKARSVRLLTPYSCRHTFATMMNRVNAPAANVQKLIGHVVGSDTKDKVYTHPEIEDLRNTIEMLQ